MSNEQAGVLLCSSKLYCSAPCTTELVGAEQRGGVVRGGGEGKKKFYILHLILNLIVSLHKYDMRGKPVCLYCD